jgi:DNA-binding NtrC family response regulator
MMVADPVGGSARPRVLFVAADDGCRRTVSALLEGAFDVTTVHDTAEALVHLRTSTVTVLCVDLPVQADALDLLRRAKQLYPAVSGVLVTTHQDYLADAPSSDALAYTVLLQPYEPHELIERVERAVARAKLHDTIGRHTSSSQMRAVKP